MPRMIANTIRHVNSPVTANFQEEALLAKPALRQCGSEPATTKNELLTAARSSTAMTISEASVVRMMRSHRHG